MEPILYQTGNLTQGSGPAKFHSFMFGKKDPAYQSLKKILFDLIDNNDEFSYEDTFDEEMCENIETNLKRESSPSNCLKTKFDGIEMMKYNDVIQRGFKKLIGREKKKLQFNIFENISNVESDFEKVVVEYRNDFYNLKTRNKRKQLTSRNYDDYYNTLREKVNSKKKSYIQYLFRHEKLFKLNLEEPITLFRIDKNRLIKIIGALGNETDIFKADILKIETDNITFLCNYKIKKKEDFFLTLYNNISNDDYCETYGINPTSKEFNMFIKLLKKESDVYIDFQKIKKGKLDKYAFRIIIKNEYLTNLLSRPLPSPAPPALLPTPTPAQRPRPRPPPRPSPTPAPPPRPSPTPAPRPRPPPTPTPAPRPQLAEPSPTLAPAPSLDGSSAAPAAGDDDDDGNNFGFGGGARKKKYRKKKSSKKKKLTKTKSSKKKKPTKSSKKKKKTTKKSNKKLK
jgi:hypothetical protein